MSATVAELLVGVLEQIGVRHIFGLIGDSLNPLADAVRRSKIDWIGVRHEEGAALAAAGQAKLTGQLGVCAGTTGPGSTHLVAGLYEASRDHAPVLALSGDMPRPMHGTDFIQTTEPDLLFRDVSLYTETISSPAQAAAVIHQAIAAAYAGPGVAHLTLPQDVLSAKAVGSASSVATLKPRSEVTPSRPTWPKSPGGSTLPTAWRSCAAPPQTTPVSAIGGAGRTASSGKHFRCPARLDRLRLRGPRGAQDEFVLAAIAQNLRRLAKLVARPPPYALQCIA